MAFDINKAVDKIPTWLFVLVLLLFVGIIIEKIYLENAPLNLWGLVIPQRGSTSTWTQVPPEDTTPFDPVHCQYRFFIIQSQVMVTPTRVGPGDLHAPMNGAGIGQAVNVEATDKSRVTTTSGMFAGLPIKLFKVCGA